MDNRSLLPSRIASIVLLSLALGSLDPSGSVAQESDEYYRGVARGLELFGEVYREILERYAGAIDPGELARDGIRGMLSGLDPYSVFVSSQVESGRATVRIGIGVEVENLSGLLTVTELHREYSAARSGLRLGDRVLAVDNVPIPEASVDTFYQRLRGERGTSVHLTVLREGAPDLLQFDLLRERIRVRSVGYAGIDDDGIIYIRLDRFGENAGNEFRTELLRLARHEHHLDEIRGVIVDLRDNSGGILEEVIEGANALLPKGDTIVIIEGRDTNEYGVWVTERGPVVPEVPLALLVNGGTASASEILAGAVQDNDRGIVVGEPTLGKGLVQSVRILPFDASLRLTTAWYITPSGRSIQRLNLLQPRIRRVIPDSLLPDTIVPRFPTESLIPHLERINAFFTFASLLTAPLDSLPSDFKVEGSVLQNFRDYGLQELVRYEERHGPLALLDSLPGRFPSGTDGRIPQLLKELRDEFIANQRAAFDREGKEIAKRLEEEIRGRYARGEEGIATALHNDAQYRAARNILLQPTMYRRLLSPPR